MNTLLGRQFPKIRKLVQKSVNWQMKDAENFKFFPWIVPLRFPGFPLNIRLILPIARLQLASLYEKIWGCIILVYVVFLDIYQFGCY